MENKTAWNPGKLVDIYEQMLANSQSGNIWKNIPGAKDILHIMKDVAPERDSEINPAIRMLICERIIGNDLIDIRDTPRLYLSYLDYWKQCNEMPKTAEDIKDTDLDQDFIHTASEMSEKIKAILSGDINVWNSLGHLKHDPVQTSPEWEENIYRIEEECESRLQDEPRCMGFCHLYWHTKSAVASKYGIDWTSPAGMNRGVMFD